MPELPELGVQTRDGPKTRERKPGKQQDAHSNKIVVNIHVPATGKTSPPRVRGPGAAFLPSETGETVMTLEK